MYTFSGVVLLTCKVYQNSSVFKHLKIYQYKDYFTSGSRGGGAPGAPPTAADIGFFYAQNASFLKKKSSLASLAIK